MTSSKVTSSFKKRNPEPEALTPEVLSLAPLEPLPPLRTFVVDLFFPGEVLGLKKQIIYAHGYDFGDNGSIAFIVVFYNHQVGPQPVKMQAPQFIFAEGTWLSVEEKHLDFPRAESDGGLSIEGN